MKVRISACDTARVRLTQRGQEVLRDYLLGHRAIHNGQLRGDLLEVPVKHLMAIFARHYESNPRGVDVPFVGNEIEFESTAPEPDPTDADTAGSHSIAAEGAG